MGFIDDFVCAMGTSNGLWSGTMWLRDIDDGINTVFYTYTLESRQMITSRAGVVLSVRFNAARPFVLNMHNGGTFIGGSQAYGDHSVAVVG